jgi:hypothetical protein
MDENREKSKLEEKKKVLVLYGSCVTIQQSFAVEIRLRVCVIIEQQLFTTEPPVK